VLQSVKMAGSGERSDVERLKARFVIQDGLQGRMTDSIISMGSQGEGGADRLSGLRWRSRVTGRRDPIDNIGPARAEKAGGLMRQI